jgi:nitroreductase/NAD-dependent dihydropyrimidine dehydrogenase PreA subunit
MLQFTVNEQRCTRCGQCVRDCPAGIIEQAGKALPGIAAAKEEECMQCQHCLAVCPTAAVSILGRNPAASLSLAPGSLPGLEQMTRLVRGRRSVRQYQDANVDPVLLRQLLATLANVPTGVNQRELTFTVIDDKDVMQRFREKVLNAIAAAVKSGRIADSSSYLAEAPAAYFEQQADILFRGAPHALIVSAPPDAPCPAEDVALAIAYFELLAQSAGLGTVWWGLLKMTLETLPELKALIGLPANCAYYGILFGLPAIRYARTVQRDDAAIVRTVAM